MGLAVDIYAIGNSMLPKTSGDWAAWAQAFGSLVAIGVTLWQLFLARRENAALRRMRATSARETLKYCVSVLDNFIKSFEHFDSTEAFTQRYLNKIDYIQSISDRIDLNGLYGEQLKATLDCQREVKIVMTNLCVMVTDAPTDQPGPLPNALEKVRTLKERLENNIAKF